MVLGASLPFVTPARSAVAGAVGGGGLEWCTREGWSFFGAAEAIGFRDSSTVVSARRPAHSVVGGARTRDDEPGRLPNCAPMSPRPWG